MHRGATEKEAQWKLQEQVGKQVEVENIFYHDGPLEDVNSTEIAKNAGSEPPTVTPLRQSLHRQYPASPEEKSTIQEEIPSMQKAETEVDTHTDEIAEASCTSKDDDEMDNMVNQLQATVEGVEGLTGMLLDLLDR